MARKIEFSKENIESIINMYMSDKMSKSKIANYFDVNPSVITRVLKENNIDSFRGNEFYQRKYSFNEDYFKVIDTEDKAYWLGFIYADGYITKGKILGIRISDIDKEHLEKFKTYIESNHPIHSYNSTNGYNVGRKFCQIELNSEYNISNIVDKGVKPRKSKILTFPNEDILPKDLTRHFIRGYFDGDGSVYISNTSVGVSFVGTLDFLNKIKDSLPINSSSRPYKYKNKVIYEYKIGGGNIVKDVYKYLYEDSTIYLERKYNKFTEIINELSRRNKKSTLTTDIVRDIKRSLLNGDKQVDIAKRYGISKSTVNSIAKGRNHAEVTV